MDVQSLTARETLTVPADMLKGTANYVLRVSNDSLECEGIREGDYLIVSPYRHVVNGDRVVVELPDCEGQLVRRLHRATDDTLVLSIGAYSAFYASEKVRIVGVIVGLIRKY
jgi:repressor LexA